MDDVKNQLDELMNQAMDRKEFLAKVGIAGLSVFGVSNVIKSLADQPKSKRGGGYGASAYGGGERKLGTLNRRVN